MSKLVEYRERFHTALKELGDLQAKEERSADDESRIDTLLSEANDLGPKIQREEQLEARNSDLAKLNESKGRQVPGNGAAKDGAEERESRRDVMAEFAEIAKTYDGRGKSKPVEVGSFYPRHAAAEYRDGQKPLERRDLIFSTGITTDYIAPQRIPGFFRGDDLFGTLRDVLINGTTTSNAIMFFSEDVYTNNATGVHEADATESAADSHTPLEVKPESAITFAQETAPVVTIAHWIPITRQTLEDASELRTYVEQRLLDGLRLAESDQLLNGTGSPDLDGLLLTTGVQDLDTAVYFAANPVSNVGDSNENYNRVLRGRQMVRTVGRARPNFAVVNPEDMEFFLTTTNADRDYYGAGPFGNGASAPTMWGMRIVEDEHITAGQVLVGDGRMAAVWDRMQAQILVDTINDQFIRNMLTLLAEERIALTVFRPAAFAVVELEAW